MHYLLDTNICIYLIKQRPGQVLNKFQKHSPADVAVSSITVFELEYGIEKSLMKDRSAKALKKFLSALNLVSFDREAASKAAAVRARLEKKGVPIGAYDLLIAGIALSRGMSLVTNNVNEFERINGLLIENWVD